MCFMTAQHCCNAFSGFCNFRRGSNLNLFCSLHFHNNSTAGFSGFCIFCRVQQPWLSLELHNDSTLTLLYCLLWFVYFQEGERSWAWLALNLTSSWWQHSIAILASMAYVSSGGAALTCSEAYIFSMTAQHYCTAFYGVCVSSEGGEILTLCFCNLWRGAAILTCSEAYIFMMTVQLYCILWFGLCIFRSV